MDAIILISILAAIPLAFLALLVWLFIKKGKIGKIISVSVFALVAYLTCEAIYPSDSFYKSEFKDITNSDFPKTGKIITKASDYPDIHGDYAACAIAAISKNDYEKLLNQIKSNKKTDTMFIYSDPWDKMEKSFGTKLDFIEKSTELNNKNEFRFWGLLKDKDIVVFYRCSS